MTDSKREAKHVIKYFQDSYVHVDDYDSLLKENQELKWEIEQFKSGVQNFKCPSCHSLAGPLYPVNLMTEITRLRDALNGAAESLGNHNDGNAVQDIMKALARADGNEGCDGL